MKKTSLIAGLLLLAGCASTFVAGKDGKAYYLGSGSGSAYRMFCESGDLEAILKATTKLTDEEKTDLYRSNCGPERSPQSVKRVYAGMTPEQRKDLRLAFKNKGYDINAMRC